METYGPQGQMCLLTGTPFGSRGDLGEPPGLGVGSGHEGRIPPREAFTGVSGSLPLRVPPHPCSSQEPDPRELRSSGTQRSGTPGAPPRMFSSRSPGPGLGQGKLSVKSLCLWESLNPPLPCSLQEPKEMVSLISCSSSVPRAREHHIGSSGYTRPTEGPWQ